MRPRNPCPRQAHARVPLRRAVGVASAGRILLPLAACVCLLAAGCREPPPPIEQARFEGATTAYYEVHGLTRDEILAEMRRAPIPQSPDWRGVAITMWNMRWNWPGWGRADCDLQGFDFSHDITVHVPRWTPRAPPSRAMVLRWNSFIRRLDEHEQAHVDLVLERLDDMRSQNMRSTCLTLEADLDAMVREINLSNAAYDRVSNHGMLWGATF